MTEQRGPHNRGKCPFYVVPQNPLSAESSIHHCANCAIGNKAQLRSFKEDLRQLAFLTVLEETPKYDPDHISGASYITFIKARVCTRLWSERKILLRQHPFTHQEDTDDDANCEHNPLVDNLTAQARAIEDVAETVTQQIEIETLRKHLPKLMDRLTQKERTVIEMKFFQEFNGAEIAEILEVSEGRVSQLTKSALEKLGKAYLAALERVQGNPYRDTEQ